MSNSPKHPGEIIDPLAVFGPPPLVEGESSSDFESLLAQLLRDLRPTDIVEQIFVHDIAHLTWELFRLRRLRVTYLRVRAKARLHNNSLSDDAAANKRVDKILEKDMEAIFALALLYDIERFERLERLIASTEVRRNATFREIDRRRSEFGARTRRLTENIDQAEFESLPKSGDAT